MALLNITQGHDFTDYNTGPCFNVVYNRTQALNTYIITQCHGFTYYNIESW